MIELIDTADNVERVLPALRRMASHRLIVRQRVEGVEDYSA